MNIYNFIGKHDLEEIKEKINKKEKFAYEKKVKCTDGTVEIEFHSCEVDEETAKKIWSNIHYLVDIQVNYNLKKGGFGGFGWANNNYSMFQSWNAFEPWFNNIMKRFHGYEIVKEEQLSLFDF